MKGHLGWDVGAWHCQNGSSRDALALVAAIKERSMPESQPRAAMACLRFAAWSPHGETGSATTGILIVENPCGDWLLGKLQRNAHHPAFAKTRALLLFQLQDAFLSAPGLQARSLFHWHPLCGQSLWLLKILYNRGEFPPLFADLSQVRKEQSISVTYCAHFSLMLRHPSLFSSLGLMGLPRIFPSRSMVYCGKSFST